MLIEITQDGAGYSDFDSKIEGFLTDHVESCSIYIFFGDKGYALIHDTAQLKFQEISKLAKKCGKITKAYYAINSNHLYKEIKVSHSNRRARLKNLLKLDNIKKIELPFGKIVVFNSGVIETEQNQISKIDLVIEKTPKKHQRENINILNNMFQPRNIQSLPIDIQYDSEVGFTEMSKVLYSLEYLEEVADKKALQGDFDFQNSLILARKLNII